MPMDTAYISALAALAGSVIGGMTSLTTTWQTQRTQLTAQRRESELARREQLYKDFIEEASRLYADAYEHDKADVANLVKLYALVSRMRVRSSAVVIVNADKVVRLIIETYLGPNRTLRDIPEMLSHEAMDPLRQFSDACRDELQRLGRG
jgi:hypothetical protein